MPLLFTRYAVRENSAGDGEHRGGFGVEVAFELRDGDAYLTLVGDRATGGPHGLLGGQTGASADHDFHTGGRMFKPPHLSKIDRLYLKPGDGCVLRTPGGGGYGDPAKRSAEARKADQLNGLYG